MSGQVIQLYAVVEPEGSDPLGIPHMPARKSANLRIFPAPYFGEGVIAPPLPQDQRGLLTGSFWRFALWLFLVELGVIATIKAMLG
jgi:hypothetical protein